MRSMQTQAQKRVVSGMRTTGSLHLGHLHGVLENWINLQYEYKCFFFAADWHALTTHYEAPDKIRDHTREMVIDWLACGMNPKACTMFVQSKVPEHAELHLLLSMITPLSWLERVPTYKDQQEMLKERDLATYGFLGYPLLQAADILIYKANLVPVGEDQVAHIEIVREVARRFNFLYGRDQDFNQRALESLNKMGPKGAQAFLKLQRSYQETGDETALEKAHSLLARQLSLSASEHERLLGFITGGGRVILPEPQALLTKASKVTGTDGQKMSKSYNNTIGLREDPKSIAQKLKIMPTDPARVRRSDPGEPEKCPVWSLHKLYSGSDDLEWAANGCRTAGIGCLDCKKLLTENLEKVLKPIRERGAVWSAEDPKKIDILLQEGSEEARDVARDVLGEVRQVMGL